MSNNPLEHFELINLFEFRVGGIVLSFTNSSLYMVCALLVLSLLFWCGVRSRSVVPSSFELAFEYMYKFVSSIVEAGAGKAGSVYAPFVFSMFMFVLACNILGVVPLPIGISPTSHISVTLTLSMIVIIVVTVCGIRNRKGDFFRLFLPLGTPWWLAPLMIPIELFTYLARPLSLAIRLTANMIAGHTIIYIISDFVLKLSIVFAWLPFLFVILMLAFEVFVAGLQAYIFASLTAVYLGDTIKHVKSHDNG